MTIEFEDSFCHAHRYIWKGDGAIGLVIKVSGRGWCVDWIATPVLDYEELKTIYDKVTELIELDSRPSTVETTPQQPAPNRA